MTRCVFHLVVNPGMSLVGFNVFLLNLINVVIGSYGCDLFEVQIISATVVFLREHVRNKAIMLTSSRP